MRATINKSRMIPRIKIIGGTAHTYTHSWNGFLQTIQIFAYTTETYKTSYLVLASRKWHSIPGTGKWSAFVGRLFHRIDKYLRCYSHYARCCNFNFQVQMQRNWQVSWQKEKMLHLNCNDFYYIHEYLYFEI